MHTIKSVGVISLAKIMGAIYAALGLLFLPIFLVAGIAGSMTGGKFGAFGAVGALFLAILFPILYGALGFVAGAIGALLYNLFANWVGGIELQLQGPAMVQPPV
jgi:hypothetical protein